MTQKFGVRASARKMSAARSAGKFPAASATPSAPLAKARTPNFFSRALVALILIAMRPAAQACAVCFGKSDAALAKGMNMGIFTLLLFIGGVLAALSCFFVFLAVRSSRHPHRNASDALPNSPSNPAHS